MQSTTQHFRDLDRGMANMLVPAGLQAHLTGVQWAKQSKSGAITLTYTDGTQETRPCRLDMLTDFAGIAGVIAYVQQGR